MNKLDFVKDTMRVEKLKDGNVWKMTITINFNFITDCPLTCNGAAMNEKTKTGRIAKWFGMGRFILSMVEAFQNDVEREQRRRQKQRSQQQDHAVLAR
jgi:hypothetical protein